MNDLRTADAAKPNHRRIRNGHGPVYLAAVRRLVVELVNLQNDKLSFRRRLLRAAQVTEYRLDIIANAAKIAETF